MKRTVIGNSIGCTQAAVNTHAGSSSSAVKNAVVSSGIVMAAEIVGAVELDSMALLAGSGP
ncbi:hypothetical protein [Xanthomonas arboricola]|uniref:hypothetical protein n=1 Tax=Xanthomonas arboricola TaxID=56448 RepID=UPI000CEEFD6A|nr:hypothetical protein [Xanthomonas arboricola]PPU38806.1 hypothetical protein XaplCFBP3123_17790 [Xanthomonas arboricola pv. populi]RYE77025.1 MAG: hypothetical protein EOO80_11690 [Oxalobacteraceae bacterium]